MKYISLPFVSLDNIVKVQSDVGVIARYGETVHLYAYSKKGSSDNYSEFIKKNKLYAYDRELINNGPKYKYGLFTRLIGMLGRLADPVELSDDFREEFLAFLIKNSKKLISFAEEAGCPQIIKFMFETGIVNEKNAKAIRKLLGASSDENISAFAGTEISTAEVKTETKATEKNLAEKNFLAEKYAQKLKEIKADKIIKKMKLKTFDMPEVSLKDGTTAPDELFMFILASYGEQYEWLDGIIPEADEAAALLTYDSLCNAMAEISDNLEVPYYPALIPMLCRFGNPSQIKQMTQSMKKWHKWSTYGIKGRRACEKLVEFLALSDTRVAALYLEKNEKLDLFAEIHGISVEEVYEKYIFDFEFNENGIRIFDTGAVTIEVSLTDDLKLQLYNTATGKNIRSLPKKGADPEKYQIAADELDDMKKSLASAVKIKQHQLFSNYIDAKEIDAEKWKNSYLKNTFLNQVARIVIWSQDKSTFILTKEGLVTSDESAYILGDSPVKIAHPMEMDKEDIALWQKYFVVHGLKQPFEQIWEPCINEQDIKEDRYKDCHVPFYYFKNQEKRGIDCWYLIKIEGFDVNSVIVPDSNCIEIKYIKPKKWNRRTNMIIAFLDRITVYGRIMKDDVSVERLLDNFTLSQITEYIELAAKNNATNVSALLLEHKKEKYPDFDPMAEFVLE